MAADDDDGDDVKKKPSKSPRASRTSRRTPRGPKRRTPTIELKAEEVSEEPKDAEDAEATVAAGEPEESSKAESAPEQEPASAAVAGASADQTESGETVGAIAAGDATEAERVTATYSEPPRTKLFELKSFATHLAAGLVGGLIAVVAVGAGVERLLLGELGGSEPAATVDTSGLEAEVKTLQGQVDALAKATPSGPSEETQKTLAALQERTARLEKDASEQSEQKTDDADRLRRLEAALKNLGETAKAEGDTIAPVAGVMAQINEFATRFDTRLAGLQDQVKKLETDTSQGGNEAASAGVEALKTQTETLTKDIAQLRQEVASGGGAETVQALGGAEQRITALEQEVKRLSDNERRQKEEGRSAALAIAFANLQRAVDNGGAYQNELNTLRALAPKDVDLSAMQARAATGIPSKADLASSFGSYANATFDAIAAPKSDDLLERLAAGARSLVRVRRGGEAEGDGPDAVIARMETSVKAGEFAQAAEEGQKLQGPARQAMQPWIDSVNRRLAVDREVDVLERKLLGAIGGTQAPGSG